MSRSAPNAEVFVYTGPGGDVVPQDVVRVRVDPSVMSIPLSSILQMQEVDRGGAV
jgi:hypothetical protein